MSKKLKIKETYIISKKTINTNSICKCCPCRIYNSSGIIRYGKGNIYGSVILILPPYKTDDLSTTPVEENITLDILFKLGINKDDCYFTRAIKCYSTSKGINRNATYNCFNTVLQEIKFINPKLIICFGNETSEYPNWIRKYNYKGQIIWSPTFMIKFYDEEAYNRIIDNIKKEIIL